MWNRRLPRTHPTAAGDVLGSKDFIIAFYAFSKLSFMIVSACLVMAPHLTCRNSCPFPFLLFRHNFHASNDVFFSPLLFHYNDFFGVCCWCTSSLAPLYLQPSYPTSPLWSPNNLMDMGPQDLWSHRTKTCVPRQTADQLLQKRIIHCLQLPRLCHIAGCPFCSLRNS